MHSQKLSEKPLAPWFVLNASGTEILCSHCTCVAGFGQACTHVASILFALQYAGTHRILVLTRHAVSRHHFII